MQGHNRKPDHFRHTAGSYRCRGICCTGSPMNYCYYMSLKMNSLTEYNMMTNLYIHSYLLSNMACLTIPLPPPPKLTRYMT